MAPSFRLKGRWPRGSSQRDGMAGKSVWGDERPGFPIGRRSRKEIGISLFDHPSNPRHPTWWHARDYGLVAANPFGVSNFEGKPKGTGDMVLRKGEEITFRYRILFHVGNPVDSEVSQKYLEWSVQKKSG